MPWDLFTKKHAAGWAILFLIVLNLTVIGTFWTTLLTRPVLPPVTAVQEPNQIVSEMPDILPFLGRELNLSRGQIAKVRKLREEALPQIREKWLEMQQLRRKVNAHLFLQETEPNEIRDWARRIGALQADLEWTKYEHLMAVQALCTPRQQTRLKALLEDAMRMARPPGRPGRGTGRGFPGGRGPGRGTGSGTGSRRGFGNGERHNNDPGRKPPL